MNRFILSSLIHSHSDSPNMSVQRNDAPKFVFVQNELLIVEETSRNGLPLSCGFTLIPRLLIPVLLVGPWK